MSEAAIEDQKNQNQPETVIDDSTIDEKIIGPEELPKPETNGSDLVEIGDHLNNLEPNPVIQQTAKTNTLEIPWSELKEIIKQTIVKHCEIMENTTGPDSKSNIETLKTTIVHSIDQHLGAPFTIQRLCELLLEPRKHYKMFIKYLRAIEKVLLVTSTWEEFAENVVDTKDKPDATFPAQDIPTGLDLEPINFDNSQPEAQEKVLKKEQAEGMEDRPVKEKTASDTDKTPLSKDGKVDTPKDPSIPMNTEEHEKDKEVAIAEANPDQKSDAQACTFEAPSAMDCDISLESPAKKEVSALQDEVETTDGSAGMDMDE